jgi:hypothetical protein
MGTARWRPFDDRLGRDPAGLHGGLRRIDVQRARCQVIDMRSAERHHVGNQAMRIM